MAVTYYALLTTIGAGKLANAAALGTTLKITQLAVGDGGGNVPTPDASRTALVNEVRRAPLNQLSIDPANSAQIIAEQVIPENVGGWWIREMGLYDDAGALIAYANCAPSYKPQLAEGSGRTQTVRIVLIVSNAASVELKIDPSVVLATREYVDNSIVTALNRLDYKQSVRAATTASITLSGLQTVDGVALAAGDRVLVKNQTNAVDNGLYVVAAGPWKRATDADENSEVTPGLIVTVESGTAQADSIWQLVNDGQITLGATALSFQNITNGLARLASPTFTGAPSAPTPQQFDYSSKLATTEYVQNVGLRSAGFYQATTTQTLPLSVVGKTIQLFSPSVFTVTLPVLASIPSGGRIEFWNNNSGTAIIRGNGSEQINLGFSVTNTVSVPSGETLTLVSGGGNGVWIGVSGSVQLSQAQASFGVTLAQNGYQKLPGGLIMQWGMVPCPANYVANTAVPFVLPMPFPNQLLWITASNTGTNLLTAATQCALTTLSVGQMVWSQSMANAGGLQASYLAIGR